MDEIKKIEQVNKLIIIKEKYNKFKKIVKSDRLDKVLFSISFTIGALLVPSSIGLFLSGIFLDLPTNLVAMFVGTAIAAYSSDALTKNKKAITYDTKKYTTKNINKRIKDIDLEIEALKNSKNYKEEIREEKNNETDNEKEIKKENVTKEKNTSKTKNKKIDSKFIDELEIMQ